MSFSIHAAAGSRLPATRPLHAAHHARPTHRIHRPGPTIAAIPVRPYRPVPVVVSPPASVIVAHPAPVVVAPRRQYTISDRAAQRFFAWTLVVLLCICTLGLILIIHHDLARWANRR